MRDWTEQQIKEMYQSEYEAVPDVWDRVEGGVKASVQQEDEAHVLHFARLGKKRMLRLCATIAACLVIVVGYVMEQGDFSISWNHEENHQTVNSVPATEASGAPEDGETTPATEASGGSGEDETARPASEEKSQVSADTAQNAVPDENAVGKQNAWMQIDGIRYRLLRTETVTADALASMQQIGAVEHVVTATAQIKDGDIYGLQITGKVYKDADGTVVVIDDADGTGYRFVKNDADE